MGMSASLNPLKHLSSLRHDWSVSAVVAGIIAPIMGYAGPLVILFQAAEAASLSAVQLTSWIWGMSIASGILCLWFSLRYKMPIMFAWNAPGSALLVTLLPGLTFNQAVGAYIMSGLLLLILGITGSFQRIVAHLPLSLAAALLAGILLQFGLSLFNQMAVEPALGIIMMAVYVSAKVINPRYAIICAVMAGLFYLLVTGNTAFNSLKWAISAPEFVAPEFTLYGFLNVAIPLTLVAISGQFITGLAVLRQDGYQPPANQIVAGSGLVSSIFALVGCHGVNLAAITAAICTGKEAHANSEKRYAGTVAGAITFFAFGLFSATLVAIIQALPASYIAIVAGLALLGAIESSLMTSVAQSSEREAALCTFLVTASGFEIFQLTSAFWGLIIGVAVLVLRRWLSAFIAK